MKNREARRRGRHKTQKCPWDPFSGSALGRILRIDLGHAPSHSEEDGDLSVQATARARPVPYSLFAVLRETAGSDPRFVDSPQGTQKGYATRSKAR